MAVQLFFFAEKPAVPEKGRETGRHAPNPQTGIHSEWRNQLRDQTIY